MAKAKGYPRPCPECQQGKHANCTTEVPADADMTAFVFCPCLMRQHHQEEGGEA